MTACLQDELDRRARLIFEGLIPELVVRRRGHVVDTSEVDDELMAVFRDHISHVCLALVPAVAGRSEQDIRREAHSLLGMGGTIGVPTLSVVAEELSTAAKQGDFTRCSELVEGLGNWMAFWSGEGGTAR